jgi:predicted AlkP superfamily phosphohydrolase/phosphomutase
MARKISRRTFLTGAAAAAAVGAAAVGTGVWLGSQSRTSRAAGKKVIVIGVDGMDPRLCAWMLSQDQLPNLKRLRDAGGFSELATSVPPQSPVAWANFINGAGPGSHGIFDFLHRHPDRPWSDDVPMNPFYGAAETLPGRGYVEVGDYNVPVEIWPFNHQRGGTVLRRQGVPFWDFLDAAGVPSTFYDLPCNYPASPSHHGHHRCLCGMGTPDLTGEMGSYQYFGEDVPEEGVRDQGGTRTRLVFSADTARVKLLGPVNGGLRTPRPIEVELRVHRDRDANAAVLEVQDRRIVLRAGTWSRWVKLDFEMTGPVTLPWDRISGICRFYLQKVRDNFQLYVSPINIDPSNPALPISEPNSFVQDISRDLGLFYTTGFQEDQKVRMNKLFSDEEYARQADLVLGERLVLFQRAVNDYDDGLLFFYFSSSDLQSHMFWWDSDEQHPIRDADEARRGFAHVWRLYQRLDRVVGDVLDRYGSQATIIVMSDHGFANFGRQFHLNTWLRAEGFLQAGNCTALSNVEWSATTAYGLGLNGLYLNIKGREPNGFVEPGQVDEFLTDIKDRLEKVVDKDREDARVIRTVYRADEIYTGSATALAPDLIVGYARGYRASWETCLGNCLDPGAAWLSDNDNAWSADHCADALEVPGVLFCNRPIRGRPALIDVAPSILAEFGLATPSSMAGRNIFP